MYKRFFAFGCSFTQYYWPTWADIIGKEFKQDQFLNFGMRGGGNEFIFNQLANAHAIHHIDKDDLVIICWTNFAREDRYKNGAWVSAGNIFTQKTYPRAWVKEWFDLRGALLKTSNMLVGATNLLENTNCKYLFISMSPMSQLDQFQSIFIDEEYQDIFDVYSAYYSKINVSITDYLYGENNCYNPNPIKLVSYNDDHPSPIQHLQYVQEYLSQLIDISLSDDTVCKIFQIEKYLRESQPIDLKKLNQDTYEF